MKMYLEFSILGEIKELKTKNNIIDIKYFNNFNTFEKLNYNNINYVLLTNSNNKEKNISVLPFYDKIILGTFLLFKIDPNENIISLSEKKFLNLLNKSNIIEDYSSDDFDLSE
jgi:hypothetical protein